MMQKQKILHLAIISNDMKNKTLEICDLIYKFECCISSARLINKDSQKMALYSLSGNWNNISKLETSLKNIELDEDTKIILTTASDEELVKNKQKGMMLYHLNIISYHEENVMPSLYNFCDANGVSILNLTADNSISGEYKVFMLNAQIEISSLSSLSDIREQFMLFCDSLNVDGIIDPVRPY